MKVKDINNVPEKYKIIDKAIHELNQLFIAIAHDYSTYINPEVKQTRIFELRNNVIYRLSSARFHLELLLNHLINTDLHLSNTYQMTAKERGNPSLFINQEIFSQQISSLFDSYIFHLGSLFDYISNLIEFCIDGKNKGVFKWMKLKRSIYDERHVYNKLNIADLIKKLDREFVGKLYDHRSFVIHDGSSGPEASFSIDLLNAQVNSRYITPLKFIKRFPELRSLSKEYEFTLQYILFWTINKSIIAVEEILFALKSNMEQNKKNDSGPLFFKNDKGEFVNVSTPYWEGYQKYKSFTL